MREINTGEIIPVIKNLCIKSCIELSDNIIDAYHVARKIETSPLCCDMLDTIIENARYAREEQMPCCQDTGMTVVFADIGQEVCWCGELSFEDAINQGVREGYLDGYLRKSVVNDPILRLNTNDNTPCMLHVRLVEGSHVTFTVMPKGAGSENMSQLTMLTPADGVNGIKKFVLETIKSAGGKPCPPLVVGIGLGGTMDKAAYLSKLALLRDIGKRNASEHIAQLELSLLDEINKLGVGTLGMGGVVTAFDVHIEAFATHIACLPVAVNLQCHSFRRATASL